MLQIIEDMYKELGTIYNTAMYVCTPESKKFLVTEAGLTLAGIIICGVTKHSNINFLSALITGVLNGDATIAFGNRRGMAIFISSLFTASIINHCRHILMENVKILTDQAIDSKMANNQLALTLCRDANPDLIISPEQIKDSYYLHIMVLELLSIFTTNILASIILGYFTNSSKVTPIQIASGMIGLNQLVSIITAGSAFIYYFSFISSSAASLKSHQEVDKARLLAFNRRLLTDDFTYLGILQNVAKIQEEYFKAFWNAYAKKELSTSNLLMKASELITELAKKSKGLLILTFSAYMGRDIFINELVHATSLLPRMSYLPINVEELLIAQLTARTFQGAINTLPDVKYAELKEGVAATFIGRLSVGSGTSLGMANSELKIPYGKITLIQGVSGCGKSTLAKMFANLKVGYKACATSLDSKLKESGAIQYISSREIASVDGMKLRDFLNSELAPEAKHCDEHLLRILKQVNLPHLNLDAIPARLSNGQGKRLLIAKAFAQGSRLLILDETFASLCSKDMSEDIPEYMPERDLVMNLVKRYAQNNSCAVIVISHEFELEKFADNTISFQSSIFDKMPQSSAVERPIIQKSNSICRG